MKLTEFPAVFIDLSKIKHAMITNTTAQVDEALTFSDCGDSTGGFRTHESLRILAAEVRRLRVEENTAQRNWNEFIDPINEYFCGLPEFQIIHEGGPSEAAKNITDMVDGLRANLADKEAKIAALESERENWRVSSVAREAVSRAEQAEAKLAALIATGDAMQDDFQRYIATRGGFSIGAPRPSINAWDKARYQAGEIPIISPKQQLDFFVTILRQVGCPVESDTDAIAAWRDSMIKSARAREGQP